jgi:hypothetical protein
MSKRWAETTQNIGESLGIIRPDDATHGKQFLVRLVLMPTRMIIGRLKKTIGIKRGDSFWRKQLGNPVGVEPICSDNPGRCPGLK